MQDRTEESFPSAAGQSETSGQGEEQAPVPKWLQLLRLVEAGCDEPTILRVLRVKPYRLRQILRSRRMRMHLALDAELGAMRSRHDAAASLRTAVHLLAGLATSGRRAEVVRKSAQALLGMVRGGHSAGHSAVSGCSVFSGRPEAGLDPSIALALTCADEVDPAAGKKVY